MRGGLRPRVAEARRQEGRARVAHAMLREGWRSRLLWCDDPSVADSCARTASSKRRCDGGSSSASSSSAADNSITTGAGGGSGSREETDDDSSFKEPSDEQNESNEHTAEENHAT